MKNFKDIVIEKLKEHVPKDSITLEIPPDLKLGNFAFPCFALAKIFKKSPQDIAQELGRKIPVDGDISKIEVKGPYLNFFIDNQTLAYEVVNEIFTKNINYAKSESKDEKVMIEYSSPNTNKAQHLGHVRNNLLGKSIANILNFNGYEVITTCLMNDKGMGVSKTIYSYMTWHNKEEPTKKPDHFVADLYVEFQNKSKENPELEEEVKIINQKFEQNDPKIMALWKKITDWVYEGYNTTYNNLDCTFDKIYYESKIYKEGKNIVQKGKEKGIFVEEEGAIMAKLEDHKLPDKVLIKSDGTSLYMTQDLYLAELKEEDFGMDRSVYVVGSEQELHFKQLFKILELLGNEWAKKCYHLSYGMIELPEGKMKSREGTTVDADDIIEEMTTLAGEEIKKRHELEQSELENRSKQIGLGGLKFFILKYDPSRNFVYDPKESISFEGETGPYIQYVYARINSIFKKHGKAPTKDINFELLNTDIENKLLNMLYSYDLTITDAANQYKPSVLARYLIEISQSFNEFYHSSQILKEKDELKNARLALCHCTQTVIKSGLKLLGIECPDAM